MSTIEACRTAAIGRHVQRYEDFANTCVAYNFPQRHCQNCKGAAAPTSLLWLQTPRLIGTSTEVAPPAPSGPRSGPSLFNMDFASRNRFVGNDVCRWAIPVLEELRPWAACLTRRAVANEAMPAPRICRAKARPAQMQCSRGRRPTEL